MKRAINFLPILLLIALSAYAKILVVVEQNYYATATGKSKIDRYRNEIKSEDGSTTQLIQWTNRTGSVRDQCYPLWQSIRNAYAADRSIEGAVLVGDVPVAKMALIAAYDSAINDTVLGFYPIDYYYMDIWDTIQNARYSSDTSIWWYSPRLQSFVAQYGNVRRDVGDKKYDIWVSRIIAKNIANLKNPSGQIMSSYDILNAYFDRVHDRMYLAARVPSRSFSMGGITEWGVTDPDVGIRLDSLGLPFHAKITHPQNNPSNWISQVQAGPRGNANGGAFDGVHNPIERNFIDNKYASMMNSATGQIKYDLDTLGYEWAGFYEHGCEPAARFNYTHFADGDHKYEFAPNNTLFSLTPSRMISNRFRKSGGYLGGFYYIVNVDSFPRRIGWAGKVATWKAPVSISGTYNAQIYYLSAPTNIDSLDLVCSLTPKNNFGTPKVIGVCKVYQRAHVTPDNADPNFENVFTIDIPSSDVATYDSVRFDAISYRQGDQIIDAIRLKGIPGTSTQNTEIVSTTQSPSFQFNDWRDRGLLDMHHEDSVSHSRYSKVPFFVMNSCHISDYIYAHSSSDGEVASDRCFGLVLAMIPNGLASIGSVTNNYQSNTYESLLSGLQKGQNLGKAYLEYVNANGGGYVSAESSPPELVLFGAGNLDAGAYIDCGALVTRNQTVTGVKNYTYNSPLHVDNMKVTGTGSSAITAPTKIRIVPESSFQYGSRVQISAY